MNPGNLLEQAREEAGLSQAALARRAGTSRPTLSAYEHDRKSPTLQTTTRIVAAAGFDLTITPRIEFQLVAADRGRPIHVPSALPRLPLDRAFTTVELPLHLNWSDRGRHYDLRDRRHGPVCTRSSCAKVGLTTFWLSWTVRCWLICGASSCSHALSGPRGTLW